MNKLQYIKNFPLLGIVITKTSTEQSYKLIWIFFYIDTFNKQNAIALYPRDLSCIFCCFKLTSMFPS